jgi:hypothetical protein
MDEPREKAQTARIPMPFKSKAQRRKFAELLMKGEISPETFEEWNRETGSAELPERVGPKKRAKRKGTRGRTAGARSRGWRSERKAGRKSTGKTARKTAGRS